MSKQTPLQFFLRLLSKRDMSQAELLHKADIQSFDKTEIDDAVKYLISKNFINDLRLASNLITHFAKIKGKRWIYQKCVTRLISEADFQQAWQDYENSQDQSVEKYDDLKKRIMQKYQIENFENIEPKTLNKIYNYLVYRGFNPHEIVSVWKDKNGN